MVEVAVVIGAVLVVAMALGACRELAVESLAVAERAAIRANQMVKASRIDTSWVSEEGLEDDSQIIRGDPFEDPDWWKNRGKDVPKSRRPDDPSNN